MSETRHPLRRFGESPSGLPCWLYEPSGRPRSLVAIHEAGHAVCALAQGLDVSGVTLKMPSVVGGSWAGAVKLPTIGGDPDQSLDPALARSGRFRRAALELAGMYQAGVIAELIHLKALPDGYVICGGQDLEVSRQLLGMVNLDSEESLHASQLWAASMLRSQWDLVCLVAGELERTLCISGHRLLTLSSGAVNDAVGVPAPAVVGAA